MKIPAIRSKIGIWVYYVAAMTFSQINEHVKRVDDELHKSALLRDMLQRSISDNYKKIAKYIAQQEERFFNSLVLAVYDGDPQWHEVRLDYGNGDEFYDIGLLELTGSEKIFPVDGQHRVEGIKEALRIDPLFGDEKIPVILIGHKTDDSGMQRARRLFSTLNRYAKPVSLRDIIALDEDDAIAIVSRELIETHPLFDGVRILDSRSKSIPESNKTAFTTIITFYECNKELLCFFLEDKEVRDAEGRKMRGKAKAAQFIRFRPDTDVLDDFNELCTSFWNSFSQNMQVIHDYLKAPASTQGLRNRAGGNILFRPVALVPFVRAVIRIKKSTSISFDEIFQRMDMLPLSLTDAIWSRILWDKISSKMIMHNHSIVELRIVHAYEPSLLDEGDRRRLVQRYASATQVSIDEAANILEIDLRD